MDVVSVLRRHGIQPSKGLGQNFLIDERILDRILEASDVQAEDVVLEVGPGIGLLTRRLAERASQVVAVELDRKMVAVLGDSLKGFDNVHVITADILAIDPIHELLTALGLDRDTRLSYKVVANLPYYITSAVLRHLLAASQRPGEMVVMVQREVAERIVADPGKLSLLALSVQVYGQPRIVSRVPAESFYPKPKIDSAILHVAMHAEPRVAADMLPLFFRVARAAFGQKRKQIHNSLTHNLHLPREVILAALETADIAPQRRAQALVVEEWVALARALAAAVR